jgi:hypothetical protein
LKTFKKYSYKKIKPWGFAPNPIRFLKNKALLPTAKASLRLADHFVGA